MAEASFLPQTLNWVTGNQINTKDNHAELCVCLYKTFEVVNLENDRFRLTTNYLSLPNQAIQTLATLCGPIDKSIYSLWKLCSWVLNPPALLVREDKTRIIAQFTNAAINQKMINWAHQRLRDNLGPGDPDPDEPTVFESFQALVTKILTVCHFLLKKTLAARDFYVSCSKWTTDLNQLRALVSSMLLGLSQRREAFTLANNLVEERNNSLQLYEEYINLSVPDIERNSRVLSGINYRTNTHFVFVDLRASFANKTIFLSHHYATNQNQLTSCLNDPFVSPISSSLDHTISQIHSFSPDREEVNSSKAERLKTRIIDFLDQFYEFQHSESQEESRASMLLNSIKFFISEGEQLNLIGIPFDRNNLGAERSTLEAAQIHLSNFIGNLKQEREKRALESKAASSELSKSLSFASLPPLINSLSWMSWFSQYKKLRQHFKSELARQSLILSSITKHYEKERLSTMNSTSEMLSFLISRYGNGDIIIPMTLQSLTKMPKATNEHIILRNYDKFHKTIVLLKNNSLLPRLDRYLIEVILDRLLLPDQRTQYFQETIEKEDSWKKEASLPTTIDPEGEQLMLATNSQYESLRRNHFLDFTEKVYETTRKIIHNNSLLSPVTDLRPKRKLKVHNTDLNSSNGNCPLFCRMNHAPYLNRCPLFSKLSPTERCDKLRSAKNFCRRCLLITKDFSKHPIINGKCPGQKHTSPCHCGSTTHHGSLHVDSNPSKFNGSKGNFNTKKYQKRDNFGNGYQKRDNSNQNGFQKKVSGQFKRQSRPQRLSSSTKVTMTHPSENISEMDVLNELNELSVNLTSLTPMNENFIQSNLTSTNPAQNSNSTGKLKRHFITCVGVGRLVSPEKDIRVGLYFDEGSVFNFAKNDFLVSLGYKSFGSWVGIIESLCAESPVTLPAYLVTFKTTSNQKVKIPVLGLEKVTDKPKIDDSIFNHIIKQTNKDRSKFVNTSGTCTFLIGLRSTRFLPRTVPLSKHFRNCFPDLKINFSPLCEKLFLSGTFLAKSTPNNNPVSKVSSFVTSMKSTPSTYPILHSRFSFSNFILFQYIKLVLSILLIHNNYSFFFTDENSPNLFLFSLSSATLLSKQISSLKSNDFQNIYQNFHHSYFSSFSHQKRILCFFLLNIIINLTSYLSYIDLKTLRNEIFINNLYLQCYENFHKRKTPFCRKSSRFPTLINKKIPKMSSFHLNLQTYVNANNDYKSPVSLDYLNFNKNILAFNFISNHLIPRIPSFFSEAQLNQFVLDKLARESIDFLRINCDICNKRSLQCLGCKFVNSNLSLEENNQLIEMTKKIRVRPHPFPQPGVKYGIFTEFLYLKNPTLVYTKHSSNHNMAKANTIKLRSRLIKNNLLNEFHEKFLDELKNNFIEKVSPEQYQQMKFENFISINYSIKLSSESTRIRLTTNASFPHPSKYPLNSLIPCGPNLLNSPNKILNNLRFSKFTAHGDLRTAYKRIFLNPLESDLLLFFWYDSPNQIETLNIYKNKKLPFGLASASSVLEISLREIIAKSCSNPLAKSCLENSRFVDDLAIEASSENDLKNAIFDLERTLKLYDFSVKKFHFLTSFPTQQNFDDENASKFLSLSFCNKSDKFRPNFSINTSKKIRGLPSGPKLSPNVISDLVVTRRVISRILGQIFSYQSLFVEPILAFLKLYFSHACKLSNSWNHDLEKFDPNFVKKFKNFCYQLINIENRILPLQRSVITNNSTLHGFFVISDASTELLSAVLYAIVKTPAGTYYSIILDAKSKRSDHSVISNELLSIKLALNLTYNYISSIEDKLSDPFSVNLFNDCKSACFFVNPAKVLSKILIKNAANHIFRLIQLISDEFQFNTKVQCSYIDTKNSSADLLSKYPKIPVVDLINSDFFRSGPKKLLDPKFPDSKDTFLTKSKSSDFRFNPPYDMRDENKIQLFSTLLQNIHDFNIKIDPPSYNRIIKAWKTANFSGTPCIIKNYFSNHSNSFQPFLMQEDFFHRLFVSCNRLIKLLSVLSRIKSLFVNFKLYKRFNSTTSISLKKQMFRSLIFTHQKLYGLPSNIKMFEILDRNGIKEISLRVPLHPNQPAVKTIPIFNPKNAKFLDMLIFHAHTKFCSVTNSRVHFPFQLTKLHLQQSQFGIFCPSVQKYIRRNLFNCAPCNKINPKPYTCSKSTLRFFEFLKNPQQILMSFISIDTISVPLRLTSLDKINRVMTLYCCECLCTNFSTFYLMENASINSTKQVIQNIQTEFSTIIQYLLLDHGSEFASLQKHTDLSFNEIKIQIIDPKNLMMSKVESNIKVIRRIVKSIFVTDKKSFPTLTVSQFLSLLILIKETLNCRPIIKYNEDTSENVFYFSPNSILRGIDFSPQQKTFDDFLRLSKSFQNFLTMTKNNNYLRDHIFSNLKQALILNSKSFSTKYYKGIKNLKPLPYDLCLMKSDQEYVICQILSLNHSQNYATVRLVKRNKQHHQGTHVRNLRLLHRSIPIEESSVHQSEDN